MDDEELQVQCFWVNKEKMRKSWKADLTNEDRDVDPTDPSQALKAIYHKVILKFIKAFLTSFQQIYRTVEPV